MGPFVDGFDIENPPIKAYLISATAQISVVGGDELIYITILDVASTNNVKDIIIIAQRLLLSEALNSAEEIAQIDFSEVLVREISTQTLKALIPNSQRRNKFTVDESPVAFVL